MSKPPVELVPRGSAQAAATPGDPSGPLVAYLQNLRDVVEGQRQVMLAYLGAAQVQAQAPVLAAAPVADAPAVAPAPPAPPAAPAPAAPTPEPAEAQSLEAVLLDIVSERTGYPAEMLDLDLDLEGDLSIDSIKRIEILGALNERMALAPPSEDGGEAQRDAMIEELAALRTLRGIIEWIEGHAAAGAPNPEEASTDFAVPAVEAQVKTGDGEVTLGRYELFLDEMPAEETDAESLRGQRVALAPDDAGVAQLLAEQLTLAGAEAVLMEGRALAEGADTVVDLAPLRPNGESRAVKELFRLAQTAAKSGSRLVAATGLGGDLGRDAPESAPQGSPGVAGLLRSLAREKPELHPRVVDLDPTSGADAMVSRLMTELQSRDPAVEVGWRGDARRVARLRAAEAGEPGALPVDPDSVLLLTGGARGITARVALAIARRAPCTMYLVGRSPLPEEAEDPALSALEGPRAIKGYILAREPGLKLREVEARHAQILAAREIRRNLAALRAAGATVHYRTLDVRDEEALAALVAELYATHGSITGVIHGAGVIEDKLLAQKTQASFDRVFDTKVTGARVLARSLREDVRFVVFFSSIASVFGNRGQADYAAANDALDKLAWSLNRRIRGRALSINWGPWDSAGMVGPELRRAYTEKGIGLIDLDAGARALIRELQALDGPPQVVLMNARPEVFEEALSPRGPGST